MKNLRGFIRAYLSFAFLFAASVGIAQTKLEAKSEHPTIYWLLFDVSPAVALGKNPPGYLVEIHRRIIEKMPNYKHQVVEVPFLRIIRQMKKQHDVCSVVILKTKEREEFIHFGSPLLKGYPAGVIARRHDPKISKYVVKSGLIDFDGILNDKTLNLGLVAERFYGRKVNESLSKKHAAKVVEKKGVNVDQELKTLLRLGRVDIYLGYPFEADKDKFAFYFIKDGLEVLDPRLACAKTEFGIKVISETEDIRRKYNLDPEFEKIYSRYYPAEEQQKFLRLLK